MIVRPTLLVPQGEGVPALRLDAGVDVHEPHGSPRVADERIT